MSSGVDRRGFLRRTWQAGISLIAAAGIWTSWDVLRSVAASGIGGVVKTGTDAEVTEIPL